MTQFGISSAWGAVAGSVASVVVILALGIPVNTGNYLWVLACILWACYCQWWWK